MGNTNASSDSGSDKNRQELHEKAEARHDSGSSTPTAVLPAGSAVNSDGIPTYAGVCGNKLITLITITASCAFALFGYDQGVMSGIISAPQFYETFPACNPAVQGQTRASLLQSTYVALYEIGCLMGAVFALMYGDRFGRKKMMTIGACIMLVGVLIQVTSFAGHWAGGQFIIGRIVTGVGNGINTSTVPTWHAETSKSHNRGLLVCIEASTISTGTAISYWIDYGLSFSSGSVSWRVPIALQCIFAFILLGAVPYLPESPRWLVSNGRLDEAQRVVAALEPAPFDSEEVIQQTRVILESLEGQKEMRKKDLFTNGPTQHFRRMAIGATSQIMQQIGGCNAVIYYAPVIFQDSLGLGRNLALILSGVNATVYALSAVVSFPTIERVGRRKLFLIGTVGQALSMFIVFGCMLPGNVQVLKGSVFGLFLYLVFFGFSWLELPWLYPAEINPLATRTNANAVSTINNWLWNFAVVEATPPMLTGIGAYTFLFFGLINVSFLPFIWIFYPETSGRSLEEIDIIFARAYTDKKSYVTVAAEMPSLTSKEIEQEAIKLGLTEVLERTHHDHGAGTQTGAAAPLPAGGA